MIEKTHVPQTSIHRIEADGVTIFYREAGPSDAPVVLLLHGFPASSFQYRELIPRLADRYRVIAPDLPGFGFTEVPGKRHSKNTFDALANTILALTDALHLKRYARYVFDDGANRLSFGHGVSRACTSHRFTERQRLRRGTRRRVGSDRALLERTSSENREILRHALDPAGLRSQYTDGVPNPDPIAPEGRTLDAAMIARPGNMEIQLDLFLDYANNVKLYPAFQEYFRKSKPPLLAIWGKHDPFFIPPGAEAFRAR